jgi:thiol-disulfide isomerase/thioredoxin
MKHCIKFIREAAIVLFVLFAGLAASSQLGAADLESGMYAPDFTFTIEPMGKLQKFSDYRGKPIALHFWATWCGPCIRELPLISKLTASNAGSLTVLSINCGEEHSDVNFFLLKHKLRLNLVMDKDNSISALYNIIAIPQTWMIDENGLIRSIQVGAYTKKTLARDLSVILKHAPQDGFYMPADL